MRGGKKSTPARGWPKGSASEQTHCGSGRIEFERLCADAWVSASRAKKPRKARSTTQDQTDPRRGFHDRNGAKRQKIATTIPTGRSSAGRTEHHRAATAERTGVFRRAGQD